MSMQRFIRCCLKRHTQERRRRKNLFTAGLNLIHLITLRWLIKNKATRLVVIIIDCEVQSIDWRFVHSIMENIVTGWICVKLGWISWNVLVVLWSGYLNFIDCNIDAVNIGSNPRKGKLETLITLGIILI